MTYHPQANFLAQCPEISAIRQAAMCTAFDFTQLRCDTLLCTDIQKVFGLENSCNGGLK